MPLNIKVPAFGLACLRWAFLGLLAGYGLLAWVSGGYQAYLSPIHFPMWMALPLSRGGLVGLTSLMVLGLLGMVFGRTYKVGVMLVLLAWTYLGLVEKTLYTHFHYLVVVVLTLFLLTDFPVLRGQIPAWQRFAWRVLALLVFFYSTVPLLQQSWLLGTPLRMILFPIQHHGFFHALALGIGPQLLAIGQVVLGLFGVAFLVWPKTRKWGVILLLAQWLMDVGLLFSPLTRQSMGLLFGLKPLLLLVFLEQETAQRVLERIKGCWKPLTEVKTPVVFGVVMVCFGLVIQGMGLFLQEPLANLWQPRLRTPVPMSFLLRNPQTGAYSRLGLEANAYQQSVISANPVFGLAYGKFIQKTLAHEHYFPEIYADSPLMKPTLNLSLVTVSIWSSPWIYPSLNR
ncbi:MAG: HTTM domain-containing protein [Candidatus Margulisiibacteriota bacterium]